MAGARGRSSLPSPRAMNSCDLKRPDATKDDTVNVSDRAGVCGSGRDQTNDENGQQLLHSFICSINGPQNRTFSENTSEMCRRFWSTRRENTREIDSYSKTGIIGLAVKPGPIKSSSRSHCR